jgi:hypothetical protein
MWVDVATHHIDEQLECFFSFRVLFCVCQPTAIVANVEANSGTHIHTRVATQMVCTCLSIAVSCEGQQCACRYQSAFANQ